MRIKTATLRNCRIHRELTVEFDPARTLIGGPNEVGKSTLVEAIHRALFLKAKGNTENHRAMQSSIHLGQPEVELTFEAGGEEYQLKKRFGTNGSTTLTSSNAAPLSADEAEEALARILSVDPGAAGKAMLGQWAHLWVWQGCAGDDPLAHATTQRDALLQRLQGAEVATALQSELDARVAGNFAEATAAIFTQAGKAKAGSELEKAESAATQAEEDWNRADLSFQKLQSAASEVESVTHEIPRVEQSLKDLEKEQASLEVREGELTRLRQAETEQTYHATSAAQNYGRLSKAEASITEKRQSVVKLEQELTPKQNRIADLGKTRESTRSEAEQAEKDYRTATEAVRMARLRRDLATAWRRSFETEEQHAKLTAKQSKVAELRGALKTAQSELAQLPNVDKGALKKLQKLETTLAEARAALDAMAAGLEVIVEGQPVHAGNQSISQGQKLILTEDTEVLVGETTRLRITPGGGTSLAEARKAEAEARDKFRRQLESLGLTSTQEAARAVERRGESAGQIETIDAALDGFGAETLDDDLAAAQAERSAAKADVERLSAPIENPPVPENKGQAEGLERELRESLKTSEIAETEAKARRDKSSQRASEAESELTEERAAIEEENRRLNNLKVEIDVLIQTHGDDAARAEAASTAKSAKEEAERVLKATQASIAALQPDLLPGDRERLKRAVDEKTKERNGLRERLAGARASLRLDGIEDPKTACDCAEARARSAREYRDSVRRKSSAIALLNELFEEEQRSLAEQFTRPLLEKISAYLQCIFGPGARAQMALEGNQFSGLRLSRPLAGTATFTFETLSGGAREQMAAAVRLAMAEVLAADHGGCLPVVFDDAFAYSDPERVRSLQRMLDLAATRGIQVIILTCNPADYSGLGARQAPLGRHAQPMAHELQPSRINNPTAQAEAQQASELEGATLRNAPSVNSEELHARFLARLRELGGKAGNAALREALGWEEATYEAVKSELVSVGRVILGRGRGGSVALPEGLA